MSTVIAEQVEQADCRQWLRVLPSESVHCCVTSPPYWGLRDYEVPPTAWGGQDECGHVWETRRYYTEKTAGKHSTESFCKPGPGNVRRLKAARWREDATCVHCGAWLGCLGQEPTVEMYVEHLVEVFRELRRVLRKDGTLWLNLGDSFLDKQIAGTPWEMAFRLREDGWRLCTDIVWDKPNTRPESVNCRPTRSHEFIFLFSRSADYFYDADAVRERAVSLGRKAPGGNCRRKGFPDGDERRRISSTLGTLAVPNPLGRNRRSVWRVATQGFPGAHFAVFPPRLIEPCILAGTPEKCCARCGAPWQKRSNLNSMHRAIGLVPSCDCFGWPSDTMLPCPECSGIGRNPKSRMTCVRCRGKGERLQENWDAFDLAACISEPGMVIDPFAGAGTTGVVALQHGRRFAGCDLNETYVAMARTRLEEAREMLP
jgi:DNA modification methylase